MSTNTVTHHRVFKAEPSKLYKAFSDPVALSAWIPPHGFLCVVHEMNFVLGGTFKMSFINFSTGSGQSFGGKFLDLQTDALIKHTDSFDNPNLPGEMTTTITFKKVFSGTELHIIQEGIPSMIPLDLCYLGWQESLNKLQQLVEPNIPDA